jgi:4-hydroxy-3-polyprenylbenzoate decarboxylase
MVAPYSTYAYGNINQAAGVWNELDRQIPGIKGVWCPNETSNPIMTIVSVEQKYEGHAKQAAMVVAGYGGSYLGRYIVIVDEDIDPSNIADVLWALGTRCDPESAIDIIGGFCGLRSDPILPPEKKNRCELVYSRAFIYACKPYSWIKEFPPSLKSSTEVLEKTREKWGKILFEDA